MDDQLNTEGIPTQPLESLPETQRISQQTVPTEALPSTETTPTTPKDVHAKWYQRAMVRTAATVDYVVAANTLLLAGTQIEQGGGYSRFIETGQDIAEQVLRNGFLDTMQNMHHLANVHQGVALAYLATATSFFVLGRIADKSADRMK